MEDRELLKLAAKAAGYEIVGEVDSTVVQPGNFAGGLVIRNDRGGDSLWNPLTDDGDALRLAVKLKLMGGYRYDSCQWEEGDPYSATRRTIVRAAAEIGRSMP